ncbi:hypothetical protein GCM10010918_22580 [Paenibacillus radicis (ex Gao et al. 2016)]|uniref:Uncharacterized protein n=1 Tax=Paenibacillus radicis (ex Gao et al. 2016) TaxID=1737354 RepID=A0A917H4P9_9BACL|nr:hypothetical protein GCM10010918_22580 [Paenibacillus radicis (ex Gao et al. 2016)]
MKSQKILIAVIALLVSVIIPILVLNIFYLIFPDFYKDGFLTGLGHMLVCGIIIFIHAILIPSIAVFYFQDLTLKFGTERGITMLINRIILLLVCSVIIQIVLSILIENPFIEPKLPEFPM